MRILNAFLSLEKYLPPSPHYKQLLCLLPKAIICVNCLVGPFHLLALCCLWCQNCCALLALPKPPSSARVFAALSLYSSSCKMEFSSYQEPVPLFRFLPFLPAQGPSSIFIFFILSFFNFHKNSGISNYSHVLLNGDSEQLVSSMRKHQRVYLHKPICKSGRLVQWLSYGFGTPTSQELAFGTMVKLWLGTHIPYWSA